MHFLSFYPYSPLKAALIHGALAFSCLGAVLVSSAAYVHYKGDEEAGSPITRLSLFDNRAIDTANTKLRLQGSTYRTGNNAITTLSQLPTGRADLSDALGLSDEPDLNINYVPVPPPAPNPEPIKPESVQQSQGVRINGQTVLPGQSLRQVKMGNSEPVIRHIDPAIDGPEQSAISEPDSGYSDEAAVLRAGTARSGPFVRFARPFANPDNKPAVAVIIGGLGVNERATQMAIEQLPPEVTLSFRPSAANLAQWVSRARNAGHEVLIEVPMEAYDNSGQRALAHLMQMGSDPVNNRQRLRDLLSSLTGYAGLINYQGDRFAGNREAVAAFMANISDRGLAFFEDGSLQETLFSELAGTARLPFGKADTRIATGSGPDDITRALMRLEARAIQNGQALGTATVSAYRLEAWQAWIADLGDKGIVLAPASYIIKRK